MFNKIKNKVKDYHPAKPLMLLYLMIPIFMCLLFITKFDNDFWFLSKTGEYIINNGIPFIEPFSIHNNFSFIAQQWLSCIIFYSFYHHLGKIGIFIFVFAIFLLIMYLFYKICMLLSENRLSLSIILTTIATILLSAIYITYRPQIFDYVVFLLMFYLLELYIRKKDKKYLYLLPLLSLLLVNLHSASLLLLFIFFIPYIIDSFKFKILDFKSENYDTLPLLITIVIMFITTFINPYGIKALTYIFTSYNNFYINDVVLEMKYPTINTVVGIVIYVSIFIVLFIYYLAKNKSIKLRYLLLLLGTIYLSLSSVKGFSYFLICSIFPLADYLKDKFYIYKDNYNYSNKFKIKYTIIVLILLTTGIIMVESNIDNMEKTNISDTVNYLKNDLKVPTSAKIYTNYDDGSYLLYNDYKVYIDPRAEVYLKSNNKKEDIFREYYYLQHGRYSVDKFLKKYDFDYLLLSEKDYVYEYISKNNTNYKLIYKEKTKTITHYLYHKN